MQTLLQHRTKLRDIISDDALYVNSHFTDAKMNYLINQAIQNVTAELRQYGVYRRQFFVVPTRYIDSYALPDDYLSSVILYDVENKTQFVPGPPEEVEVYQNTFDGEFMMGDRFSVDERERKLKFLDTTNLDGVTDIPVVYHISAFDRTTNAIKVDYAVLSYSTFDKVVMTDTSAVVTMETTAQITAGDVIVEAGGVPVDTTVLTVDSSTQITMSNVAIDDDTDITIQGVGAVLSNFGGKDDVKGYLKLYNATDDIEYVRYSKTIANTDDTYTVVIPDWDLLRVGGSVDFDGESLVFVPYVLIYDALPPTLSADAGICYLPNEIDYLVPTYAAIGAYRNSMEESKMQTQFQFYEIEKKKVIENLTGDRSRLSNQEQVIANENWRGGYGATYK